MYNPQSNRYEPGWRPPTEDPFHDAEGMPVDPGLIHVGGEGRWQDIVDTKTGEHSVKEHTLKLVKQWCHPKDHNWVETDPGKREIQCTICGQETRYVLGFCKLVDGKLVEITSGT